LEADLTLLPALTEMNGAVKKVRPYLMDSHLIAYAGLYFPWQRNQTMESVDSEPFNGFYRVLMEAHIPFRVISRRDLLDGDLADLRTIVLPNAVRMSDTEIDAVCHFVESGGGLVMTYRTAFEDERGSLRDKPGLADIAGVRGPFGLLTNPSYADYPRMYEILPQHYYRVPSGHPVGEGVADRLLSFQGGLVEFEVGPEAAEAAHVLDFDYGRMHWHHTVVGWYPGDRLAPLIAVRERAGRVVYVGGELARAVVEEGDPAPFDLLANAVKWSGRAPMPVEINVPPSVEVVAHSSQTPGANVVFLINRTCNGRGNWVRYVVPLHDIRMRIAGIESQPAKVFTLTGASVTCEMGANGAEVCLSQLGEYEGIVITT
jgi:hypothetical protein